MREAGEVVCQTVACSDTIHRTRRRLAGLTIGLLALVSLAACSAAAPAPEAAVGYSQTIDSLTPVELGPNQPLRVVTTTNLVADIVGRVGGANAGVVSLLPFGADPHSYSVTPRDLRQVAQADLVVASGLGLDASLLAHLSLAAPSVPIVSASEGIEPLAFGSPQAAAEHSDHEQEPAQSAANQAEMGVDPHVWFDPIRVRQWAENAAAALSRLDPANQVAYQANRDQVVVELDELDRWIRQQVQSVPAPQRLLVTDHLALTYFAQRYDFEIVGALIPAYSSSADISAQELAALQELIDSRQVRALFVGASANPALAQQMGADLGVPVVRLYTGSLGEPGAEADSYFAFMRYDVQAIVGALSP